MKLFDVQGIEIAATADTVFGFVREPSVALAQSRVTDTSSRAGCIYSFILHAPPVPLEQIEGALEQQSLTLREELAKLTSLMEHTG